MTNECASIFNHTIYPTPNMNRKTLAEIKKCTHDPEMNKIKMHYVKNSSKSLNFILDRNKKVYII